MRSSIVLRVAAVASLIGISGCDPLNIQQAASILSQSLDRNTDKATRELLDAVSRAVDESIEVRTEFQSIADEYQIVAGRFPIAVGTEGRAFLDFAIQRLKDNTAATSEITRLLNAKRYGEALVAFRKLHDANPLGRPPEISRASPATLAMVWTGSKSFRPDTTATTILFAGHDFTLEQADALRVEIRDSDDRVLRNETKHFKVGTRYEANLDIAPGSGIAFTSEDRTILVSHGGHLLCQVSITWPKPPVPEVKRIRVKLGSITHTPRHLAGDPDFCTHDDYPMHVAVIGETRFNDNRIETRAYMHAREHGPDWTEVGSWSNEIKNGEREVVVVFGIRIKVPTFGEGQWQSAYNAPGGWKIMQVSPVGRSEGRIDINDHGERDINLAAGEVVGHFHIWGDTDGDEAGTFTRVQVDFNDVEVSLQHVLPP